MSAFILSSASMMFRDMQKKNREADIRKNILKAVGIGISKTCNSSPDKCCNIEDCYAKNIRAFLINSKSVKIQKKIIPEFVDLEKEISKSEDERVYPVFTRVKDNKLIALCIPLAGKGLWGSIHGFMALEKDLNTIKGITFYSHSETPGLGAEIEEKWFLDGFKGKKIFNEKGELISVSIVKGKVMNPDIDKHRVDGISGATLTSSAVQNIMKNCLFIYEPYIRMLSKGR